MVRMCEDMASVDSSYVEDDQICVIHLRGIESLI